MRLIIFTGPGFKAFLIFSGFLDHYPCRPLMTGCRNLFRNFVSADFADLLAASGLLTSHFFYSLPFAVAVGDLLDTALRAFLYFSTNRAVDRFHALFRTGGLMVYSVIRIPGVPCRRDLLCLCVITDSAGECLYTCFCAGGFCCDFPFIVLMPGCG